MGDTAASLGNAMDELMRHQPTLKQPAMAAIVKVSICIPTPPILAKEYAEILTPHHM